MKNNFFYLYTLCLLLHITSCDVQKRIYRKGFYSSGISHVNRKKTTGFLSPAESTAKNAGTRMDQSPVSISVPSCTEILPVCQERDSVGQAVVSKHVKHEDARATHAVRELKDFNVSERPLVPDEVDFEEERSLKTMSIVSFILSLLPYLSLFVSSLGVYFLGIGIAFAIVALVLSNICIKRAKKFPYRVDGIGFARAGRVLSIVYLALLVLAFLLVILFLASLF